MKTRITLPDFAGVALVDILANGLAMLIIVIVLSIAARTEHEQRTSAQVEEVETMMSRRFSTSLVLNSLAASPPARLHDYHASPLDIDPTPDTLPIIELHKKFVREYHGGAIWSREELLHEANAMDAWLSAFGDDRKLRLRTDVYDIAQFYLVMSILRDHGISVRHWHFLDGGGLSIAAAGRCPPGVSSQDCAGGGGGGASLPNLAGGGGGDGAGQWPPPDGDGAGDGSGDGGGQAPFPGGAAVGAAAGFGDGAGDGGDGDPSGSGGLGGVGGGLGGLGGFGSGSFPNAQPGGQGGGARGLLGAQGSGSGDGGQTVFRLSRPESLQPQQGGAFNQPPPSPEQILTVLLDFIGKLQATVDAGESPAALLANFQPIIKRGLASPPTPARAMRETIARVFTEVQRPYRNITVDTLRVTPLTVTDTVTNTVTSIVIPTNRRLRGVAVTRADATTTKSLPSTARPVLRLNAHPDIWRGLSLPLAPNGILLLPPQQQRRDELRWRAVAYIAPAFNDFIIGFAYAKVDSGGRLAVATDDNQVRLNGSALQTPYQPATFGARNWLVALYVALVLGLLTVVLTRRRTVRTVTQ